LVSVLMNRCAMEDAWHEPMPKLKVLTAGPEPHDSTDLLGSERFAEFMHRARNSFDYVLVDAPPVELGPDTAMLAAHSDGVLLVIDAKRTRKSSVRQSVRSLEAVGVDVLGTVMTNYKPR
jgi:Mrp family chromosome partitioning ATPase